MEVVLQVADVVVILLLVPVDDNAGLVEVGRDDGDDGGVFGRVLAGVLLDRRGLGEVAELTRVAGVDGGRVLASPGPETDKSG